MICDHIQLLNLCLFVEHHCSAAAAGWSMVNLEGSPLVMWNLICMREQHYASRDRRVQVSIKGHPLHLPVTLHSSNKNLNAAKKVKFRQNLFFFFPNETKCPRWHKSTSHLKSLTPNNVSIFSCQSVPECDEDRRINEEDDRRREGEEKEEEEEDDRNSDEGFMGMTPLLQAHHAMERMEEFVHKVRNTHTYCTDTLTQVHMYHIMFKCFHVFSPFITNTSSAFCILPLNLAPLYRGHLTTTLNKPTY